MTVYSGFDIGGFRTRPLAGRVFWNAKADNPTRIVRVQYANVSPVPAEPAAKRIMHIKLIKTCTAVLHSYAEREDLGCVHRLYYPLSTKTLDQGFRSNGSKSKT